MKTRCKFILFSASCLAILGIAQFGGMQYLSTYIVGEDESGRMGQVMDKLQGQGQELIDVRLRLSEERPHGVEGVRLESPVNMRPQCSATEDIEFNNASVQISHLVEELDFASGHGGHEESMYPYIRGDPVEGEELRVFLIPHSHCDPGWLQTYTQYYESTVRGILTFLVDFAVRTPEFKFIYAEVSFFKLWWDEQEDSVKQSVKKLAKDGQFEFVQGGWVQADEANTHYFALFNQMLDGHDWLLENLPEAVPVSGWAIDPFGLSPMMAYVNKLFGLQGMHIQRVHYTVKSHLAKKRLLDFRWRQSWDKTGVTDIKANLGPFASYTAVHTCGPDPAICCQFDFPRMENYRGNCKGLNPQPITLENVAERSLLVLDQWRKKASLHSTRNVFVELGDDFRYGFSGEAELMYSNYKEWR